MNARDHKIDTDRELAGQFQVIDKEAFRQLHELHGTAIRLFLMSRCSDRDVADELSQEVWTRAWAKRAMFKDMHFRGWVFEIARNLLIDHKRRKSLAQMPEDMTVVAPLEHDRADELMALDDCLKSGTGDFVQAVRDSLLGLTTQEIAAKHKIAEPTVYTRISRGQKLLRDCVEEKLK